MVDFNKILQGLGIPYSAIISIIFGMMILSFPIGAFLVFNTNIGEAITFEFPIKGLSLLSDVNYSIPLELGDVFIVLWCIFLILFSISMLGPKRDFLKTLMGILSEGKYSTNSNYLVAMISWFSILILISGIINYLQEGVGITIVPPLGDNQLIQFVDVTIAPLIEELGFRVLLIGIPLYVIYSHKVSVIHFFKSLWNPYANLHIYETKKTIILIVVVAVFFGISHIIFEDSWNNGKFAQATASGIIIGWVYSRYGLAPAILIHWATNYFIFSYVYFVAEINQISVAEAFAHSLLNSLEILFLAAGVLSCIVLYLNYYCKKNKILEI